MSELLRDHGFDRATTSLVLVGHGTPRHPGAGTRRCSWRRRSRRRRVAGEVLAGFLDDDPPVETCAGDSLAFRTCIVVPFLIGGGAHVLGRHPPAGQTGRRWRLATGDSRLAFIDDQSIGS